MGWSIGYDEHWKRDVGYGVPAICDHPGCSEKINRGLSYVCGGEPYGGDRGCGLYFCSKHLLLPQLCTQCVGPKRPRKLFTPTPDTLQWMYHKMTDPSWAEWRVEQGIEPKKGGSNSMTKHIQMQCKSKNCSGACNACGLKRCSVCNGAETSLPTECPGRRMSAFEKMGVVNGIFDYYDGAWRWVSGAEEIL